MKCFFFLLIVVLACGGCASKSGPATVNIWFGDSSRAYLKKGERDIPVEEFRVIESDLLNAAYPEHLFIEMIATHDIAHFRPVSILVNHPYGSYSLLRNEDDVISFLRARTENIKTQKDIRQFVELFCLLRGYSLVVKPPAVEDARIRAGDKRFKAPKDEEYNFSIIEEDKKWTVGVSLYQNDCSGSIARYTFKFPKIVEVWIFHPMFDYSKEDGQYFSDYCR